MTIENLRITVQDLRFTWQKHREKTTFEERKESAPYCINHNYDYKNTASKHEVFYSQVYPRAKKCDTDGESGLTDKRGRHKTDNEVGDQERLRCKNLRLKYQSGKNDRTVDLLKK